MRAVVFDEYGPAERLRIEQVARPVPRAGEVRIRVCAATVSAEDPKLRRFDHPPLFWLPIALLFGYPRPRKRILGMELSGVVDAVGERVTRFAIGDAVFGYTGIGLGAHAEYACVSEQGVLAHKPSELSFEQAAAVPNGALTALVYLRNLARLRPGERVLVYGASGAVGAMAVQIARQLGARVTGVCSTPNQQLVASLGVERVLDYTRQDFTRDGSVYDVVFDTVGKTSLAQVRRCLSPRGRYLLTVFGLRELLQMLWSWLGRGVRVLGGASNFHWTAADLAQIASWIRAGELRSVVDRCYPLAAAAEAHRYVESGHKRGNVVLTLAEP